jgi:hypothetical protein
MAGGIAAVEAQAEMCPNAQVRAAEAGAAEPPDCRGYEQVSPVGKNLTDALGEPGFVEASPSGDGVSFFSIAPLTATTGSEGQVPTYVSVRVTEGESWVTDGLLPSGVSGSKERIIGLDEDLNRAIVVVAAPAETGPETSNAYVEDTANGSLELLAANIGQETFSFADATPDGTRILFETKADLQTTNVAGAAGVTNLYEWNEAKPPGERVSLAGVLLDGQAPTGGSVAGPGGLATAPLDPGGSGSELYTQETISENGSRVFFTDVDTGIIYMREPEAQRTVQVSAGSEPAYWRAATPDGRFVFYTEGDDLYRYDVEAARREAITDGSAGVLGTLGTSDDGSYIYFVATAKLASNEGGVGEAAEVGADNLYAWHEDIATHTVSTTFVAKLLGPSSEENKDGADWRDYEEDKAEPTGPSGGEKSSRVTPDGKAVLFSSVAPLTGYDNAGKTELYLYDAESRTASCVSCNPSRTAAVDNTHLTNGNLNLAAEPAPRNAFLTHNLSDNGDRVFFETEEALVAGDTNNQLDVYEWEREGTGSCESTSASLSESNGGCLYLISTGHSSEPSYFGDASASGDDVFFFTRQSLVGQDDDLNVDVYDARVDGGIAAQNPARPAVPCGSETSCRPWSDPSPVFDTPSSTNNSSEGNLAPQPAVRQKSKSKRLTRAQELARALRTCRKQPRKQRHGCQALASRCYGKRPPKTARER